jgi:hypothetical protein
MDTKCLPTNGIHYRAQGHVKIGIVCAQRWLSMHYNYDNLPTIVHNCAQPSALCIQPSGNTLSIINVFDLSGRKLLTINGTWGSSLNPRLPISNRRQIGQAGLWNHKLGDMCLEWYGTGILLAKPSSK